MPQPSREGDADRVGPLPTRLKIHAHLNLSSTTLSSVGSYRTDSSGALSQANSRWSQDFPNTANSGFGGGSPRSETRKGPREGREKRRAKIVVPPSMINALGLFPIEDPKKEVFIAEAVIRHLDKQRRDARDGEIKAAVDDLEGSVEHWTARFEAWKQRRADMRIKGLPYMFVDHNECELKRRAITDRVGELKEDIKLLNSQDRANELYGGTISKCAAAIHDMETGFLGLNTRSAIVANEIIAEQKSLQTNRAISSSTDEESKQLHSNGHQGTDSSNAMVFSDGQSKEADQTKALNSLATETTINTRNGETADEYSQTETLLKDAETQTSSPEEHPQSVAIGRHSHHLLILNRHQERIDQLKTTARTLNDTAERTKVYLKQPNIKTFIGCTRPLRDRLNMLQDDIAALMESVRRAKEDPSCKEYNLQHHYRDLRMDVAFLKIGAASHVRNFEKWEIEQETKTPKERIRRRNTTEQMSWMKPMRPQRTRSQTEAPVLPAPGESAERVENANKPQSDAWYTQTPISSTSSLRTDHTLVAHATDTSDEELHLKPEALSVSQTEQGARKDDVDAKETVSTASPSSVIERSAGRTLEIKQDNLDTIHLKCLCYYQQHQLLKAEIGSLERRLQTQPNESAPLIEKCREQVTRLMRNADILHKQTRFLPEMKRLTRDLSDIIGEGSATLHNLLYVEDEQKRREKQKDVVTQCQRENNDHIRPTFQPPPKILRPDPSRRDSGYFELSPIEECFIPYSASITPNVGC